MHFISLDPFRRHRRFRKTATVLTIWTTKDDKKGRGLFSLLYFFSLKRIEMTLSLFTSTLEKLQSNGLTESNY